MRARHVCGVGERAGRGPAPRTPQRMQTRLALRVVL